MKKFLIILILVVVIALFSGTWIFSFMEWITLKLSKLWHALGTVFDFFKWNKFLR